MNTCPSFCTSLEVPAIHSNSPLLCLFYVHFSLIQITFVPCYHDRDLIWEEVFEFLHPDFHFLERINICLVIYYNSTFCPTIINLVKSMVPFLTSCVPYKKFNSGSVCLYPFFHASCIYSGGLLLIKLVLAKPESEWSFSNSCYWMRLTWEAYLLLKLLFLLDWSFFYPLPIII